MAKKIDITALLNKAHRYYLTLRSEKGAQVSMGFINTKSQLASKMSQFAAETGASQITAILGDDMMRKDSHGYSIFNVSIGIQQV